MISIIVSENSESCCNVTAEQIVKIKSLIDAKYKAGRSIEDFVIQNVSIIYSSEVSGGYKESDRYELISGDSITYSEEILGFNFNVSPFAFFQVNTNVFEKMLNEISAFLNINKETVVFDICCGTGAIGICLSKMAKKVLGFELVEAAVENAKKNVELNKDKIEPGKCQFFAGRAEYLLPEIAKEESEKDSTIVGIVDPPRSGLHRDILRALRCTKGLNRLVYVSCNAVSQMRDMQHLCYATEKRRKAPPFKPVHCIGADLFP